MLYKQFIEKKQYKDVKGHSFNLSRAPGKPERPCVFSNTDISGRNHELLVKTDTKNSQHSALCSNIVIHSDNSQVSSDISVSNTTNGGELIKKSDISNTYHNGRAVIKSQKCNNDRDNNVVKHSAEAVTENSVQANIVNQHGDSFKNAINTTSQVDYNVVKGNEDAGKKVVISDVVVIENNGSDMDNGCKLAHEGSPSPVSINTHDGSAGRDKVLVKKVLVKKHETVIKGNKDTHSSCGILDGLKQNNLQPTYTHHIKGAEKQTGVTFHNTLPRGYVSPRS